MPIRKVRTVSQRLEKAILKDKDNKIKRILSNMDDKRLMGPYLRLAIKHKHHRALDALLRCDWLEPIHIDTLSLAFGLITNPDDLDEAIYKLLASPKCGLENTVLSMPYGNILLNEACKADNLCLLEELLRLGVDPGYDDSIVLSHAISHPRIIYRLLEDKRVNPGARSNSLFAEAIKLDYHELVLMLMSDSRVDITANNAIGYAINGKYFILAKLLNDHRIKTYLNPEYYERLASLPAVKAIIGADSEG